MAESSKSGARFSRRGFVRTGLGVGTALLLPNLPGVGAVASAAAAHDHEPVSHDAGSKDFEPGAPFVEPEIRRSANGELNTTLRMQYAYKDIGGHRLYVRTYEGTVPAPTLRLKPGDVLRIKLINDMPPNRDPEPIDHLLPHRFNTTNFHSHGLHVSPSGISDNVMRMMEPGESYDIEIAIPSDGALPRRERRARTDHHHAAWRGAALAHPACRLAGRLVP
jgi:FtsP/CotA-like multicopper oxidase with cupredoxin domain